MKLDSYPRTHLPSQRFKTKAAMPPMTTQASQSKTFYKRAMTLTMLDSNKSHARSGKLDSSIYKRVMQLTLVE
jgi:hypothetical protein